MGSCWSSRVKAESPLHHGAASSSCRKDGNNSGDLSSRVSWVPQTPRTEGEILQSSNLKSFSFNVLTVATRNFRPDSVLGEGGFGCVFKGWIDEQTFAAAKPGTGLVIAVKRLNTEGIQGHKEWLAEINYLGQLYHPNLVRLIGYCLEDEHRLLVYEFMPRGSLENHLFRRSSYHHPLPWKIRLRVALGSAKGLAFLHSDRAKVIYRDFKTSNILLDSGQYSLAGALKAASIAIKCLSPEPKARPLMHDVVTALEQLNESEERFGATAGQPNLGRDSSAASKYRRRSANDIYIGKSLASYPRPVHAPVVHA
ncbi:hypothetical protein SAY86_008054 [Trapa natans]|uniref:non-specific serine/threonine protein kinase n=1 Tax=Trapa natans TaxID=22666 RepID=A0AAN7R0Q5_TRANT|nr:hypothetical protein SAY86_008054 [Trapa natans]